MGGYRGYVYVAYIKFIIIGCKLDLKFIFKSTVIGCIVDCSKVVVPKKTEIFIPMISNEECI